MENPSQPGADNDPVQIEGTIERIIFQSADDGFTVADFQPVEGARIIVVGRFADVAGGMPLSLRGRWGHHARYGKQFIVESYDMNLPRTELGMRKFLVTFIKGVGPTTAKAIVETFGVDAVEILDGDPKRILEVPGIGRKKAKMIKDSWDEHRRLRTVMLFLQSHNIGASHAMKIYRRYGETAMQALKENPYVLTALDGIGFKSADSIAANFGVERDAPIRLRAGIEYVLGEALGDGHTYLPEDVLVETAAKMLEAGEESVRAALNDCLREDDRMINDDGIYLAMYQYAESAVAKKLARVMRYRDRLFGADVTDDQLTVVERDLGFELTAEQRSVLEILGREKMVILTGGPGTGKTATTRAVIRLFENMGRKVQLTAPTGRAAKRLSEATGSPASTIHRLLEFSPQKGAFVRDARNPLEADLLIVDETSMVDILLMHYLARALRDNARLLLVGDADQLPSVGAGNVLRDLIASDMAPTVRLNRIFRQDEESSIVFNAHRINRGEMPVLTKKPGSSFHFVEKDDPQEALSMMVSLCTKFIPEKFGFRPIEDIQVLSPMYRGPVGVESLNEVLQEKLNPNKPVTCGGRSFRIGDKVMQTKNNYEKDVFNGDIGAVSHIDLEERLLTVRFPEHEVNYAFADLDQIIMAYAITVHKSQGSEYPAVVIPISTQHYPMLQRNLIYTAITRAREVVVLVGSKRAIAIAVKNNRIEERYSALGKRLTKELASGPGLFLSEE